MKVATIERKLFECERELAGLRGKPRADRVAYNRKSTLYRKRGRLVRRLAEKGGAPTSAMCH
jgi:hypothetical protein